MGCGCSVRVSTEPTVAAVKLVPAPLHAPPSGCDAGELRITLHGLSHIANDYDLLSKGRFFVVVKSGAEVLRTATHKASQSDTVPLGDVAFSLTLAENVQRTRGTWSSVSARTTWT